MAVDWNVEREKMKEFAGNGSKLNDGDMIDIRDIVKIDPIVDVFKNADGTEDKAQRFMYYMKDGMVLKVPLVVYRDMGDREKDGFIIMKIEKKGTGRFGTKYKVIGWERRQ
jgi:hypothetical protein